MAEFTREDFDKLSAKIDLIVEKVIKLETLQATEADRCPFRVDISYIVNNVARLERLESRIAKLELTWAKALGLILGAGALGGGVSQALAKFF